MFPGGLRSPYPTQCIADTAELLFELGQVLSSVTRQRGGFDLTPRQAHFVDAARSAAERVGMFAKRRRISCRNRAREFLKHLGCVVDELLCKLLHEIGSAECPQGFEGADVERRGSGLDPLGRIERAGPLRRGGDAVDPFRRNCRFEALLLKHIKDLSLTQPLLRYVDVVKVFKTVTQPPRPHFEPLALSSGFVLRRTAGRPPSPRPPVRVWLKHERDA